MFAPVNNKRVYEHVVDQIQQQILNGELKKGDKLPTEKTLIEQLSISRTSVREALRALEVTGIIENRLGEGYFVSGVMGSTLIEPLTAMFMLNNGTPKDLLEFRTIIESHAAELAAMRITSDQAFHLQSLLDSLGDTKLEEQRANIDIELHHYIAQITGNILIINMSHIIAKMVDTFIHTSRRKILENPNNEAKLLEYHVKIVQSIIDQDPEAARTNMIAHMTMINEIVQP